MQQRLGKYVLGSLIGRGGMGAVYESFHPVLQRPVAVKLIDERAAVDPETRRRFLREAQTVAALSHPHIVNIYDVDEHDGRPFIVMEHYRAGSLADRLARGMIPLDEALSIAAALADALDYAHDQGVVHRDLKPANVLLRDDGAPVLADFGLARPALPHPAEQITVAGTVLGTIAYMAPEQFSGDQPDARSDLYALGVVLYELLTGRAPFQGATAEVMRGHIQDAPRPPRTLAPSIPQDAERLVLRLLEKSPAARPQTAAEVARDLRVIMDRGAATGPTVALPQQDVPKLAPGAPGPASGARRPPWGWVAGGMIAALVLAGWLTWPQATPTATPGEVVTTSVSITISTSVTAEGAALLEQVREPRISGAEPAGAGPERFSVGGVTAFRSSSDALWFFGEVRNDGDEPREAVEVRVLLLDESGGEVLSKTGYAERDYLGPGEVSPFSVLFTDKDAAPLPAFADYRVEVRSKQQGFAAENTVRELAVDVLWVGEGFGGMVTATGMLRNTSSRPIEFSEAIITFYGDDGAVVGVASGFAEDGEDNTLNPRESAPFAVMWSSFSERPVSYHIAAEGKRYD